MTIRNSRREFFGLATGALAAGPVPKRVLGQTAAGKPALLGGTPVHKGGGPGGRSGGSPGSPPSSRSCAAASGTAAGRTGAAFESAYAKLLGAKRCLATASGTTALIVGMHVLDVDAGDEVIVSPFTFIATYNAILMHKALPVFADTDPATLTMDPASIESRITERTRAILPVHIYGMPCDMDPIVAIAKKHRLAVIEDACQAWLAEYKGRKCGTLGDLGCFSFQNSKHLPSGEGGAITGNSDDLIDRASPSTTAGGLRRLQGRAPISRAAATTACSTSRRRSCCSSSTSCARTRRGGAERRRPGRAAEGDPGHHAGAPAGKQPGRLASLPVPLRRRADSRGCRASSSSGRCGPKAFPCSAGYREQYFDGLVDEAIASRGFKRLFSAGDSKDYRDSFRELKGNRQVCATTVGIRRTCSWPNAADIDHIAEAIRKIQAHGAELAKT